ncbi:hypothetical protein [Leisingera sp. JC1]|uniref:hypothetical protein n=1 Tax=Leisingera sp. JC1 TaxID=1855282 RepID=UPI000803AFF5|nr:hypothetical protein [Leisingera sp. JC1]OBY24383.1 hypothetical protein A9D60_24385 [Leisingera sp. JC1]
MRFSEETRYPHPVLAHDTGDFIAGEFDMRFTLSEDIATGALSLEHNTTLTEGGIRKLVETGKASVGCFVRCSDTYHTELRNLTWPTGRTDFAAGVLLNRVSLRPIVWLKGRLTGWNPGTIHPEFSPPVDMNGGDIIAIGEEHIISVGQAKLAPIESIFELDRSPDVPEGTLQVELERDRITILAGEKTHETIMLLREQKTGKPVVMSSIYLPAVMEVLDALQSGADQYEPYRWHAPFTARCDARGVDPKADVSILESAQKLLDGPASGLAQLIAEADR